MGRRFSEKMVLDPDDGGELLNFWKKEQTNRQKQFDINSPTMTFVRRIIFQSFFFLLLLAAAWWLIGSVVVSSLNRKVRI